MFSKAANRGSGGGISGARCSSALQGSARFGDSSVGVRRCRQGVRRAVTVAMWVLFVFRAGKAAVSASDPQQRARRAERQARFDAGLPAGPGQVPHATSLAG